MIKQGKVIKSTWQEHDCSSRVYSRPVPGLCRSRVFASLFSRYAGPLSGLRCYEILRKFRRPHVARQKGLGHSHSSQLPILSPFLFLSFLSTLCSRLPGWLFCVCSLLRCPRGAQLPIDCTSRHGQCRLEKHRAFQTLHGVPVPVHETTPYPRLATTTAMVMAMELSRGRGRSARRWETIPRPSFFLCLLLAATWTPCHASTVDLSEDPYLNIITTVPACGMDCLIRLTPGINSSCLAIDSTAACLCEDDIGYYISVLNCVQEVCTEEESIGASLREGRRELLMAAETARGAWHACGKPRRTRKADLLGSMSIEMTALLCVLLRLFSRWWTVSRFEADDYIMMVVTVCCHG